MGRPDKLTDGLTYTDLAGRRRLRRYLLAAAAIFILIGAIIYLGWQQQQLLLVQGAGAPTSVNTAAPQAEGTLIPTDSGFALVDTQPSPTPAPPAESSTAVSSARHPTPKACPDDPSAWELLDIARNDNFKKINPPCVYDGLARTVAWHILSHMGYSKPEAAEILGFPNIPWQPALEITGMTNQMGPMSFSLVWEWPAHPDYYNWIVSDDGRPWITYALRGCYRTATIDGDQMKSWGVEYSVVCILTLDYAPIRWSVHVLDEYVFSFDGTKENGKRVFVQYGYTTDKDWVLIGQQEEPQVAFDDVVQMQKDREFSTRLLGVVPWDSYWVEAQFGIDLRPLPDGWKMFTNEAGMQEIGNELNAFIQQSSGP